MIIGKNGNELNEEIGCNAYIGNHSYLHSDNMECPYMVDISDKDEMGNVFVFGARIDRYMNLEVAMALLQ